MIKIDELRTGDKVRRTASYSGDRGNVFTVKFRDGNPMAYANPDAELDEADYSIVFPENWELVTQSIRIPEDLQVGDVVKNEAQIYTVEKSNNGDYLVARSKDGGVALNFRNPHKWEFVDRPLHVTVPEDKPPLGLKPRKLHDEERFDELAAAIERKVDAKKAIPPVWIEEYNELHGRLS